MVPNDWNHITFAQLIKTGDIKRIQDGNHGNSHPKSSDFVSSGIPFIMARDLNNGSIDFNNCAYIPKKQADSLRIGFAVTGDVLLSHKGTVGEVAIVPKIDDYIMLTPQVTYYRMPSTSRLLNTYLYQYLLSNGFQSRLKSLAGQSTRSYLGITAQKELYINLPPLPEQQKIAKILSTWDKAIATTERLIATSQQQKKALMQQLLTGKKRLCSSPKGSPETGLEFEGEWEEVSLGDIVDRPICYGVLKPGENTEGGVPLLRIQDLKTNKINIDKMIRITDGLHQEFKRTILREGDLVISIVGTLGKVLMVPKQLDGANITRAFAVIGVSGHESLFIKQYLSSDYIQEWLLNTATGNAQKVLNIAAIKKLIIRIPSLFEQQKIASVLTAADKEIELLQAKLSHLKQEKKALMQQLLTGKRRVKVDETEAA
jgi:type I restriction enzyme, S subunit